MITLKLDTNMVSYIVRGRSPAARARLLDLKPDSIVCVSAITEGEIRFGVAKRPEATALRTAMEAALARFRILPWGSDEAKIYGDLRVKLECSGKTLGNMDMLIAAHAVTTDAILVMNDKAFNQVDDLTATVNWAADITNGPTPL